jgi:hypothetical protein
MIPLVWLTMFSLMATVAAAQPVSSGVLSYFAYRQPRQVYVPLKPAPNTAKALSRQKLSLERSEEPAPSRTSSGERRPGQEVTSFVSASLLEGNEGEPREKLEISAVKSSPIKSPIVARIFSKWRVDATGGLTRPVLNSGSQLRLGYSDIFETRGNPDKGGHGVSILFKHNFSKPHR